MAGGMIGDGPSEGDADNRKPVDKTLDEMAEELSELQRLLDTLKGRLSPVSMPNETLTADTLQAGLISASTLRTSDDRVEFHPPEPTPKVQFHSPIRGRLQGLKRDIYLARDQIVRMTQNLDI